MKLVLQIVLLFASGIVHGQNCEDITASKEHIAGSLKHNVLKGENAFNELWVKTGIGPYGDLDTREYTPLIYSSSIWNGGVDPNANLKFAAGEYNEQDWWMGPLNDTGSTDASICEAWDRVFSFTKEDFLHARDIFNNGGDCSDLPESILNWPGKNNPNLTELFSDFSQARYADFIDSDGNGIYEPCKGDLPYLNVAGCGGNFDVDEINFLPDMVSFYMMNDNGAIHDLSNATAIQMQKSVYSFSFKSEEAKDIIFWMHRNTAKGTDFIDQFFESFRVDFDLGCKENDLIGSLPRKDMIYAYNDPDVEALCIDSEKKIDPNLMVGVSILSSVKSYYNIESNNGEDTLIPSWLGIQDYDTILYNKSISAIIPTECFTGDNNCEASTALEFYNLQRGLNVDGSPVLDENGNITTYQFDGNPAEQNSWSQCHSNIVPQTTAILSSGESNFNPGQREDIIYASFVARDIDESCPDVAPIAYMQEQAQKMYDNCFFNYLTPIPPKVLAKVENSGIILSFEDIPFSYSEFVPFAGFENNWYQFEGIKVYQVRSANFDMTELGNPDLSYLVYQGDIENDISDLYNYKARFDGAVKSFVPELKVGGGNSGIENQVTLEYDYLNDEAYQEGKEYFFVAVSYAYNNYQDFDSSTGLGQQYPYLESTCGLITVKPELTNSISDDIQENAYSLNVTNNDIELTNVKEPLNVSLFSYDGKLVQSWRVSKNNRFNTELGENLPTGLYLLNIISSENRINNTHKMVVR